MSLGLRLRGTDVVNERAKLRDVFDICKDHVALCKTKVGMLLS